MNVFSLNDDAVRSYQEFSRSFVTIAATDLRDAVAAAYAERPYAPEPLVSMNPRFRPAATVDDHVASGALHADTGRVFRSSDGAPLRFHEHQAFAIGQARAGRSFVVTTGTGSGKSLCYFVPIVDAVLRARTAGDAAPRTGAIVVYLMNALANSQMEEIGKFLRQSGLACPPTVARYTGQEGREERERIASNPPDILLTNFVMLELLMTRNDELGRRVMANAQGLRWLVLDELHTYRGRQGADVALLVRRLHERLAPDGLQCVGTSATMGSGEDGADPRPVVAEVAAALFAAPVDASHVVTETLERATQGEPAREDLAAAVRARDVARPNDELRSHPLAIWAETRVGVEDGATLRRRPPTTIADAAQRLSEECGEPANDCRAALEELIVAASRPDEDRGRKGAQVFLPFKLHQFVSGPDSLYAHAGPAGRAPGAPRQAGVRPRGPAARPPLRDALLPLMRAGVPPRADRGRRGRGPPPGTVHRRGAGRRHG